MSTSESLEALHRANPRAAAGFAQSVEAAAGAVRARIDADTGDPVTVPTRRRGRLVRLAAAGAVLAATAGVAASTIESPRGPGVEDAVAAVRKAATVTSAAAQRSGTAVVRVTHGGEFWSGSTIRWHDDDVSVSSDAPSRHGRAGSVLLVVDDTLYGIDPRTGGWIDQGDPASIDPDSGTTPDEYLAAVRTDIGGATLRRIVGGMTGLTTSRLGDGSTLYRGTLAAGLIARETAFKEGRSLRVLPFGYPAHGEAADPAAPLQATVTVGADGIVRELHVSWGPRESPWRYTVAYSRLGATPALVAPANARSLLRERARAARSQ